MSYSTTVDATPIARLALDQESSGRARPRDAPDEEEQTVLTTAEKIHVGADVDRGSAHTVTVTAANDADIGQLPHLVREDGDAISADAGYKSDSYKRGACEPSIAWCVNDRRKTGHGKLSGTGAWRATSPSCTPAMAARWRATRCSPHCESQVSCPLSVALR